MSSPDPLLLVIGHTAALVPLPVVVLPPLAPPLAHDPPIHERLVCVEGGNAVVGVMACVAVARLVACLVPRFAACAVGNSCCHKFGSPKSRFAGMKRARPSTGAG